MEKAKEIEKKLREKAEEKYKQFQEKLCPGIKNIMGVRIPELRKMAKEMAQKEGEIVLREMNTNFYEEKMLYGFILGYTKLDWDVRMQYLKKFVSLIDNWAVCDSCITSFKFIQKNRKMFWAYLEEYAKSDKEYENRFVLICLLDHYLVPEYENKVYEMMDKISSDQYYVSMAKAWLIAELWIRNEEKTKAYLEKAKITQITYQRAIQKLLDSYRVDQKKKDELRRQKRIK